jgi:hypothetical protein
MEINLFSFYAGRSTTLLYREAGVIASQTIISYKTFPNVKILLCIVFVFLSNSLSSICPE